MRRLKFLFDAEHAARGAHMLAPMSARLCRSQAGHKPLDGLG